MSDKTTGDVAKRAVVDVEGVPATGRYRPGKRSGQDDLPWLQRYAVLRKTLGQPGNAIGRVIQHAGSDTGFFDYAIAVEQGGNPAQIDIHRLDRPTAHDDAGIGGVVGNGVHHFARALAVRVNPLRTGIDQFQRRNHVVGGGEYVQHADVFTFQAVLQDEGQLNLDHRHDEAVKRNLSTIGENHVIEQRAVVGLVDLRRHLHGARSQPDFVADDFAPLS